MDTGEALLAAILAAPEEDAPRLVYADWLQEHGDEERAESIRLSLRRDSVGRGQRAWYIKSHKLAAEHPEWYAPFRLYSGGRDDNGTVRWRRGFVHAVTCTAADWLRHADALTWRPGQTVECPEVKWQVVRGVVDPDTHRRRKQDKYKDCGPCAPWCKGGCNGTGRVHRPCPPTAQPIRAVTLTTWPELEVEHSGGNFWNRLVGRTWLPTATTPALLKAEWPGITFHLPPEPRRDQYAHWNPVTLATRNLATPIRFTDEMLRDMGTGYNAGDAVMEAWQREMGIPLPAADDEPPTV